MTEWFGTDGLRAKTNGDFLTEQFVQCLARAIATTGSDVPRRALLAQDGRISGDMLRASLASGLMSAGWDVGDLGVLPTPGLAYLTRENDVSDGLMISASHNPYYDNGIKGFQPTGEKWTKDREETIESVQRSDQINRCVNERIGRYVSMARGVDNYIADLSQSFRGFEGHVVLDCANGATSSWAEKVFTDRCGKLTMIHHQPNGLNINESSGSMHPETLKNKVKSAGADIGFAFDGDGDRVVAVDDRGDLVNGDVLIYMLACHFSAANQLPGEGVIFTVMSNLGLRQALEAKNINYQVVGVGDRNVYNRMVENGWRLGGEQSGHLIDRQWLPTGDGIRTACSVLRVLQRTNTPISEWNDRVKQYPQILHNIPVPAKLPLEQLEETSREIEQVENRLGEEGRILVRYSGTEPVARVMLEGSNPDDLEQYAHSIGEQLETEINQTVESGP